MLREEGGRVVEGGLGKFPNGVWFLEPPGPESFPNELDIAFFSYIYFKFFQISGVAYTNNLYICEVGFVLNLQRLNLFSLMVVSELGFWGFDIFLGYHSAEGLEGFRVFSWVKFQCSELGTME